MIWHDYARRLIEVIGLRGSPVAITYSMTPAANAEPGKHWVCQAFVDARDGKIINLTKETSACRGGTTYLGLGPRPEGDADKALKKFLVEGEKLFCSIAVFKRSDALAAQPPLGLAENVVFAPMDRAEMMPDLALFIVNAEQACRLIQLATYWNGVSPKAEMTGSACRMAVTYPLMSGEINVSFLDWTARKHRPYAPDELIVTIPYHRLPGVVEAIDVCSAGTAPVEYPPEFRRLVADG